MRNWGKRSYESLRRDGYTDADIIASAGRSNRKWSAGMIGGGTAIAAGRAAA